MFIVLPHVLIIGLYCAGFVKGRSFGFYLVLCPGTLSGVVLFCFDCSGVNNAEDEIKFVEFMRVLMG